MEGGPPTDLPQVGEGSQQLPDMQSHIQAGQPRPNLSGQKQLRDGSRPTPFISQPPQQDEHGFGNPLPTEPRLCQLDKEGSRGDLGAPPPPLVLPRSGLPPESTPSLQARFSRPGSSFFVTAQPVFSSNRQCNLGRAFVCVRVCANHRSSH